MTTIPVDTSNGRYIGAVAQLPLRTVMTAEPSGAITVISGSGDWVAQAVAAATKGAKAIIVTDPCSTEPSKLEEAVELSSMLPLIMERRRLRHDVAKQAAESFQICPRAIQVICGTGTDDVEPVLRDAIGWMRTIAGEELVHRFGRFFEQRGMLQLVTTRGPLAGGLLIVPSSRGAWIRMIALDNNRMEITVDNRGDVLVELAGQGGITRLERRYESMERAAIRRALDAIAENGRPTDAADLRHDASLAIRALASPKNES